jgi:RNA polymerase sigma-70 factor (ECF subfamily)
MDEPLFQRWRQGDFEAFLELVRPHLPSLRALVACHAPPGQALADYDDISQDVLVAAFRSAADYDPGRGGLKAWLRGVARNGIRRAWQEAARNRRRAGQAADFAARRAAAERDLARDLDADPVLEALERCLAKLPGRGAQIVRAHYGEGLPAAEIARRLGLTPGAVYVDLHRLRQSLRRCVEESLGRAIVQAPG